VPVGNLMPLYANTIGTIFDNYADAIEGGNSYRGVGDAYKGVAGVGTNNPETRNGNDSPLTATAISGTTKFSVASSYSWDQERWVKEETPPWFFLGKTATNPGNVGAARKISAYNNTTKQFTFAAFPSALTIADTFYVMEGFKRLPNNIDIEDEGPEMRGGFDRSFQLSAESGGRLAWYGNGYHTYQTTMELRIRFLKYARNRDIIETAIENMMLLRSVLTRGDHRDGVYVRSLVLDDKAKVETVKEDREKIVVKDSYVLTYAVDTTLI